MVEAVFFDLDGTLADTAPDLGGALNALLVEEGRPPLAMAVLRPHVSAGARGLLKVGFGLLPEQPDYLPLRERLLDHYEARLCADTSLFPGMAELLSALESRSIAWGIVTNKPERFTRPLVASLGLHVRAAAIVAGDSVARPKPAPDGLLRACAIAGSRAGRSLYVGDDLRDIQAAHAAGMRAIGAAYGYLGDGPPLAEWDADGEIASPVELLAFL